ncbi:MAG: zinc-dependent alcohol dehydrogenase [Anaerolineae bacterium]|jgi:threonine dehydrogenase-like Zn-dependent dehydrogenase
MKATGVFYVAPEKVELREYEIGDPDLYEVQIELKASALCAWDQAIYKGVVPPGYTYPFIHGHEGVGVVRKVGARVTGFKEGDKVTAMGNDSHLFGQIANVPPRFLVKLDDDVEDYQNWLAEPVACVMNGLEWSGIVPGDRVALIGTGFMGLIFVQGLRHTLAQEIIAMDINPRRLELARQFGADRIIDLSTPEGQKEVEALKSNPVDLVVEAAGAQAAFDLNYSILREGGRLNIFSWHKADYRQVDLGAWHMMGIQVYNASPSISPDFPRILKRTVPMMKRGVFCLELLITHVMPADRAPEMFDIAYHQSDGYIKGVLCW